MGGAKDREGGRKGGHRTPNSPPEGSVFLPFRFAALLALPILAGFFL